MFKKIIVFQAVLLLTLALVLAGCGANAQPGAGNTKKSIEGTVKVTTTTGMISDIVKNVGGEHVEVQGLMGPGVDPHLYKASQGDIAKLKKADIIFYNGLNLEGKMADIFVRMSREKPAIAVTEYIPESQLREPPDFAGHYDPHVWFDVKLWMKAVERVRDGLIEVAPDRKADFEKNTQQYLKQLEELDAYAKQQLAQIPKKQRVLVTAHDAFGYFGTAYDLEVTGLQGISTDSEYGLQDVQNLVDMLVQRKIKAVFIESSVPKRAIEAVVEGAKAKNHIVTVGGELFSDAMGDPGTQGGTYIGMVKHNVDTIVAALK
ncbi:manganese transporter [Effusibacillus lacus]|uniref:Manganese transporter n=2 Tax=Effusibacillus lacus TaxID=1348429 RepID=A0A292YM35_9BACL|nr:manganese transporter [Effusibacillus lacus]